MARGDMCCYGQSDNQCHTDNVGHGPLPPGHVPVTPVQQLPDPPPDLVEASAPGPQQELDCVTCVSQSEVREGSMSHTV